MPLPILYTGTAGRRNLVHTWTTNCSNLVLENDTLKMSLFDGGYVSYPQQKTPLDPTYGSDKKPAWHYYLKDHLGSNRVVMSASGTPEQINHYYPYGGLMGESQNITSSQRYKYNGKELDRTHDLDWYNYGARMYDAALARWTTVDPLAEKYPDVSPYVYCHDNPMNAVDPDGRDVLIWYKDRFGKNRSFLYNGTQKLVPNNSFVLDFIHTYHYLKSNKVGDNLIKAVRMSSSFIELQQADETMYQNSNRRYTIFWEPRKGIILTNGKKQSPAVRLEHEFDHAMDDLKNHKAHEERKSIPDYQYGNKEERRATRGSETKTARRLHQGIRNNHRGTEYSVKDPRFTK